MVGMISKEKQSVCVCERERSGIHNQFKSKKGEVVQSNFTSPYFHFVSSIHVILLRQ